MTILASNVNPWEQRSFSSDINYQPLNCSQNSQQQGPEGHARSGPWIKVKASNERKKKRLQSNMRTDHPRSEQFSFPFVSLLFRPERRVIWDSLFRFGEPCRKREKKKRRGPSIEHGEIIEDVRRVSVASSISGVLGEMSMTMRIVWPNWLRTRPQAKHFTPSTCHGIKINYLCFAFRRRVKREPAQHGASRRTKCLSFQHVFMA